MPSSNPTACLSDISQTMLLTLYMRHLESRRENGLIGSPLYSEMIGKIDFDFSKWDGQDDLQLFIGARTRLFDEMVREFIIEFPDGVIVSIASGLGIAFTLAEQSRIDWYDVDLPPVIELRQRLFGQKERLHCIASSAWDYSWMAEIPKNRPILVVIEGLLLYFKEAEIRDLFAALIESLNARQIVFDSISEAILQLETARRPSYNDWDKTPYCWGIDDVTSIASWHPRIRIDKIGYQTDLFGARCPSMIKTMLDVSPDFRNNFRVTRVCIEP